MNALSTFAGLETWHIAGWTMLHYLWLGALVGVLAIVARLLLRRAAANFRYAVALCCLLLLAALPFGIAIWQIEDSPPLFQYTQQVATSEDIYPEIIELNPQTASSIELDSAASRGVPAPVLPIPTLQKPVISFATLESCVPYLPWLWIIGTPITFALLATGIIGTKRLRIASRTIDDPRIAELMTRLTTSQRIGRRVTVALCERIASPVLIGIVRPIILLPPAALSGWSPDEIEMVLLHELAHVRRWDNLVNLLQRLIESLLFFHPAVWLISTWVRRERESCCDAFVVRRTERPHAYAELLVALAAQMPRSVLFHPAASSAMSAGPLKSRIRRILQLEDDPMLISGKSLTLMLASLFIAATLAVFYLPTIGQAEESTTEVTEGTEKKNNEDANRADTQPPEETIIGDGIRATAREIEVKENGNVFLKGVRTIEQVESTADEKDALLREIAELQTRKGNLEAQLSGLQTDFTVLKGRLNEKNQNQPNSELQKLTKEFQVNSGALKKQLTGLNEALAEKMETMSQVSTADESPATNELRTSSQTIELKPAAEATDHANRHKSEQPQVVATLSVDALSTHEFKQAYEAARRNKQYVDIVYRDNGSELVTVPEPNEANWPNVLGDVPRKERVIADKAYARLGLKLAPFTNAESTYRQITGKRLGVQIIGGNVPQGLPLPATLTAVGGQSVSNMDELLGWLESERGQRADSVKCNASADDNEYLFESVIAEEKLSISQDAPTDLTMSPGPAAQTKVAFPSLEDQKLTDLVWKRLRLEMESIDEKELERVKTLGYDGGLKVSAGIAGLPFSGAGVGENIGPGDILVCLHVWPTTTMKDLVAVLNRDDLAELGPLKFYVIRQGDGFGASGERVVTGRVSVTQAVPSANTSRSSPQPVQTIPSPASAPASAISLYHVPPKLLPNSSKSEPVVNAPTSLFAHEPSVASVATKATPTPAGNQKSPLQPSPNDRIVVAYDIPTELRNVVIQHQGMARLRGLWDERRRFVVQATPQRHEQFKNLLDATPTWRESIAQRQRRLNGAPINLTIEKVDGMDVLEWPATGLKFARETRPEYRGVVVAEVAPGSPGAWQDIRPGDVLARVEEFEVISLAELESIIKSLLESFSNDRHLSTLFVSPSKGGGQQYSKQLSLRFQDTINSPSNTPTAPGLESRRAAAQQQFEMARAGASAQNLLGATEKKSTNSQSDRAYRDSIVKVDKENLRYDGKSFLQWRDTWRTELSINKRLDAVKALAAFGAQGYAPEATETILDVVAEYDARPLPLDTPEAGLKQAVKDGMITKIPHSVWRPLLRKRFDADPEKWQWLAVATLPNIEHTDDEDRKVTQEFLLQLARSEETRVSSPSVSALVKLDPALENDETKQLVMDRLNSNQLHVVKQILSDLGTRTPQHPQELIDLLLHGDPQKQMLIRQAFHPSASYKANLALIGTLTALIKDETKATDHLAAIRALAALGQAAERAESKPVDALQAFVNHANAELQVAAAVAISQITRGQTGDWPLLTDKLRDADGNDLDAAAIQKLTQTEREAIFGKPN